MASFPISVCYCMLYHYYDYFICVLYFIAFALMRIQFRVTEPMSDMARVVVCFPNLATYRMTGNNSFGSTDGVSDRWHDQLPWVIKCGWMVPISRETTLACPKWWVASDMYHVCHTPLFAPRPSRTRGDRTRANVPGTRQKQPLSIRPASPLTMNRCLRE